MPANLHHIIHVALERAAAEGYAYLVERFLEVDGINPNFGGNPPPERTIGYDHVDGFSADLKPKFGPPLVSAARGGHSAVVELLLAAVNIDPNARDQNGTTALCSACKNGHISIVKQLLARGDVDLNAHGFHGRLTPLTTACYNNHTEIINLLLSKEGIDVNLQALNGETALYLALSTGWNRLEAVKLLLEREDIDINLPKINGRTPLHQAIRRRDLSIVKLLLGKKGIDPNVRDNEGYTPLAMACTGDLCNDTTSIVGLLLSHCNTDPNPVDNNGVSALTKVIRNDIREFLIRLFKEDHEKNREEIKSLICAAVRGHQDVPKSWP